LTIRFKFKEGPQQEFKHDNGLAEYITALLGTRTPLHTDPILINKTVDDVQVELVAQYTDADSELVVSYVNNISTIDGGTHLAGFRSALTRTINNYAEEKELNKNGALSGDDIREGLTCILSLKVPDPKFLGQTKAKLVNQEVRKPVDAIVTEKLGEWLDENPKDAKTVIEKALQARQVRLAAKKARELERKKVGIGSLQGILTPCSSRDRDECELFIVEGQSAGGSAKKGRDIRTQAILPLRGKPLNVEKVDVNKMLKNKEIQTIITALGCGIETVGDFDLKKLRYGKVVLLADADVDGAHIVVLLLTFFFRHMLKLIEEGHLYVACPPLFKITKGRHMVYVHNEEDKQAIIDSLDMTPGKLTIQRYKGLGEMDAKQLRETTMDPDGRTMLKLTIDNYEETKQAFERLMGNDPEPRREFIYSKALDAEVDV
jgi:DNA gyrase subunit B